MKIDYSQKWGVDSNLFVYLIDADSIFHHKTFSLFEDLLKHHTSLFTSSNNLVETHRVLTSFYKVDKILALDKIIDTISALKIQLISPLPTTIKTYYQLCQSSPKNDLFDIFFASIFVDNHIHHVFTNNTKDFVGLGKEIKVHCPF